VRLHRGGRLRGWLGHLLGGDAALGDRIWRRCLHGLGALVLVYYLLPPGFFVVLSNAAVLLLALGAVLLLEGLRWYGRLDLPTIRPFERDRVASFAYFAVALVAAVLLFPTPIAVAVVLGTALVDPLIGEMRLSERARRGLPAVPIAVYALLAFACFRGIGEWGWGFAAGAAVLAAALAIAVERLRARHLDDDLTMTIVPGAVLTVLLLAQPALTGLGR
jgi:hypothetical protein